MLKITTALALVTLLNGAASAQDVAKGEKVMKKCKACHMIVDGDEVFYKGGKTGPNLYGIIGRPAASYDGYKYSKGMIAAGEAGLVWDEENLVGYLQNPSGFLKEFLDDKGAKSKMSLKLKKGMEDVIAYLGTFGES